MRTARARRLIDDTEKYVTNNSKSEYANNLYFKLRNAYDPIRIIENLSLLFTTKITNHSFH